MRCSGVNICHQDFSHLTMSYPENAGCLWYPCLAPSVCKNCSGRETSGKVILCLGITRKGLRTGSCLWLYSLHLSSFPPSLPPFLCSSVILKTSLSVHDLQVENMSHCYSTSESVQPSLPSIRPKLCPSGCFPLAFFYSPAKVFAGFIIFLTGCWLIFFLLFKFIVKSG